jgi:hypothetical protein
MGTTSIPAAPGETERLLGNHQRCFRIASNHHDLRTGGRGVNPREGGSQKFRNRLGRVRESVDETLAAANARLPAGVFSNFLQFRHPRPLSSQRGVVSAPPISLYVFPPRGIAAHQR